MNFYSQYKNYIFSEKRISRNLIEPRNIYKISSYEYATGDTKSLTGPNSSLIFVIGKYDNNTKLSCIKLNGVKPEIFFKWIKTIRVGYLNKENFKSDTKLENYLIKFPINGSQLFETYIKGKPLYNLNPSPYRTYSINNILYVSEVNIKEEIIKAYLL